MSNAAVTPAQYAAMLARGIVPTIPVGALLRARKPRTAKPVAMAGHSCRWSVTVVVPLRIVNGMNHREHHFARSRRVKAERKMVEDALSWVTLPTLWQQIKGVVVTMTRFWTRDKPWDTDQLSSGFKAARDQIAVWLEMDDGAACITWKTNQRKSKVVGVEIRIEAEA